MNRNTVKAKLYAHYGVRELWVVDAASRRTFVHRGPMEIGWSEIIETESDAALSCAAIPDFAIKLAEV